MLSNTSSSFVGPGPFDGSQAKELGSAVPQESACNNHQASVNGWGRSSCPNCGYCPTCGRPNWAPYGPFPYYPYNQPYITFSSANGVRIQ